MKWLICWQKIFDSKFWSVGKIIPIFSGNSTHNLQISLSKICTPTPNITYVYIQCMFLFSYNFCDYLFNLKEIESKQNGELKLQQMQARDNTRKGQREAVKFWQGRGDKVTKRQIQTRSFVIQREGDTKTQRDMDNFKVNKDKKWVCFSVVSNCKCYLEGVFHL